MSLLSGIAVLCHRQVASDYWAVIMCYPKMRMTAGNISPHETAKRENSKGHWMPGP